MNEDNKYYIYMHINKINDKKYIGLSGVDPQKRWGKNGSGYRNNKQPAFSRAIQKYGWDNFEHVIISDGLSKEEAMQMEIELIQEYDTQNPEHGYNIQPGGQLGNAGIKFSDETKKKLSDAHKGKTLSEEHKKKISESCKGHKPAQHSEEFIQKQRERNTGKIMSQETRDKISKTLTGIKRSAETKMKMSENRVNCIKVYCPEYDMEFKSLVDAQSFTGANRNNINKCLKGERHTAGRHKETDEKLHWIKVEK